MRWFFEWAYRELLINAIAGMIAGGFLVVVINDYASAVIAGALWGAFFCVHLTLIYRTGRVLFFFDVRKMPRFNSLPKLRKLSFPLQNRLQGEYRRLQRKLVELLIKNEISGASYQEQIAIAGLFYQLHKKRLWATSLNSLSDFLHSNPDYCEIMGRVANDGHKNIIKPDSKRQRDYPPPRARVFVLPAELFVKDVISHPVAARDLATSHLERWSTDFRPFCVRAMNPRSI